MLNLKCPFGVSFLSSGGWNFFKIRHLSVVCQLARLYSYLPGISKYLRNMKKFGKCHSKIWHFGVPMTLNWGYHGNSGCRTGFLWAPPMYLRTDPSKGTRLSQICTAGITSTKAETGGVSQRSHLFLGGCHLFLGAWQLLLPGWLFFCKFISPLLGNLGSHCPLSRAPRGCSLQ